MNQSKENPIQPVFDGHNDVLLKLWSLGADTPEQRAEAVQKFRTGCGGHIDVPRSRAGGFAGGFFAIYVPSPMSEDDILGFESAMRTPAYDLPLPEMVSHSDALPTALAQAAILHEMQAQGAVKICTSVADIRAARAAGTIAAILHIEGAEAIGEDLAALEVLYGAGLRSIGPVWSRPTVFGHGVPFRYPSDGDTGAGLTEAGKALVRRCNALGILVDLSHLNMAGFWDVAEISDAPLVATHSNAWALSPHSRNLVDAQLDAVKASNGMVGLNFAAAFLRQDGQMRANTPLAQMLAHLDYLIARCGEDHVGLGSDFDGATVPDDIQDVSGLPNLVNAMQDHGYGSVLIEKICFENWMRVVDATLKSP